MSSGYLLVATLLQFKLFIVALKAFHNTYATHPHIYIQIHITIFRHLRTTILHWVAVVVVTPGDDVTTLQQTTLRSKWRRALTHALPCFFFICLLFCMLVIGEVFCISYLCICKCVCVCVWISQADLIGFDLIFQLKTLDHVTPLCSDCLFESCLEQHELSQQDIYLMKDIRIVPLLSLQGI